jgi:hypothetical protein
MHKFGAPHASISLETDSAEEAPIREIKVRSAGIHKSPDRPALAFDAPAAIVDRQRFRAGEGARVITASEGRNAARFSDAPSPPIIDPTRHAPFASEKRAPVDCLQSQRLNSVRVSRRRDASNSIG